MALGEPLGTGSGAWKLRENAEGGVGGGECGRVGGEVRWKCWASLMYVEVWGAVAVNGDSEIAAPWTGAIECGMVGRGVIGGGLGFADDGRV